MTGRRRCAVCLTLLSILILTRGSPTSSPGLPTSPHGVATSSTGESKEQTNLARKEERRGGDSPSQTHEDMQGGTSEDDQFVTEVLLKYGYFRQGKPLHLQGESGDGVRHRRGAERGVADQKEARAEAIRKFQSFFGLPLTGVADKETITLMKKGRCGVADLPEEEEPQRPHHIMGDSQSPSDYSLLGTKWETNTLTWRLDSPSNQLRPSDQRHTMEDAFAMWSQVAPLRFEHKRGQGPVDIRIKFGRRRHGDDYPFDGKGKVLAHAFGPGKAPISGDMHLDNDEEWTVDLDQGTSNLFLVATHELGHSLGLAHSRDPSALMFPYYGLTDSLGQDDIKAIQSLYGIRIGEPVTTKPRRRQRTTTTTTTTEPVTRFKWAKSATYAKKRPRPRKKPRAGCDVKFDAVFQDDVRNADVYTGIQKDLVFRFTHRGLLNGYPSALHDIYPGAPRNADAVFGLPEKSATYFIKGNTVWRYTGSRLDPAYPKDLNPSHFRETIRFVLPVVDAGGVQRIFVFGRTLWLEYNFDDLPSYTPRAHVIPQYWPDVASDVIYAVTGYDGNLYFVSPRSHVILNSFRRAVHGGKRKGHPHWLQPVCHMADVSSGSTSLPSFGSTFAMALFVIILSVLRKR